MARNKFNAECGGSESAFVFRRTVFLPLDAELNPSFYCTCTSLAVVGTDTLNQKGFYV